MKETKIALRVLTAWSEKIYHQPYKNMKETVFHRLTINGHIVTDVALSKKGKNVNHFDDTGIVITWPHKLFP